MTIGQVVLKSVLAIIIYFVAPLVLGVIVICGLVASVWNRMRAAIAPYNRG